MPRKRSDPDGVIPIPYGWEVGQDFDGKLFYIDHQSRQTSWIDPRDRYTKPSSFADCVGDELPYGWEQTIDPQIGIYYTNHINKSTQLEDPRQQWREQQELMLKDYLACAHDHLLAKKEILTVKEERLAIAQEEVQNLHDKMSHMKASRTSLNSMLSSSSTSSTSTKYDPDLLKADVSHAKARVARLRRELEQIQTEMKYKERGLETLTQVDAKMAVPHSVYSLDEAQEIVSRIRDNQRSLHMGEREKADLVLNLARLKDEVMISRLAGGSSPDVSTLSLPQEKISTESQTDLSGEYAGEEHRWGDIVRMKLQYDEARKQVGTLSEQLASIESQMIPGQVDSDKDRLLLIQEKEQLLRELRSVPKTPKGRSAEEIALARERIAQLEYDLQAARELSSKQIAERLKLNESKSVLLQRLMEATKITTYLESQLKSLSVSTSSMSSGSSRGSLGSLSASSKGSLSSLSLSDIYSSMANHNLPEVNLPDLHRRVEKLLQDHNISTIQEDVAMDTPHPEVAMDTQMGHRPSTSQGSSSSSVLSASFPTVSSYALNPPPSYEQHMNMKHVVATPAVDYGLQARFSTLSLHSEPQQGQGNSPSVPGNSPSGRCIPTLPFQQGVPSSEVPVATNNRRNLCATDCEPSSGNPPLSPISESSSGVCNNLSGMNTRSVSAAVSDESVAGDSGVFEASMKRSGELDEVFEMSLESAQVQIKLKYEREEGILQIGVEQARNLAALAFPPHSQCQVCIKAALLPSSGDFCMTTNCARELNNPWFKQSFRVPLVENKLASKTLQVQVCCVTDKQQEECLGCAQVSLASFDPDRVAMNWYNVLSFKFMQSDSGASQSTHSGPNSVNSSRSSLVNAHNVQNHMTGQDRVTQLLEASSARLRGKASSVSMDEKNPAERDVRLRSSSFDSTYFRPQHSSAITSVKEESSMSSDESTIISSQTSTLTRSACPEDMVGHLGEGTENSGPEDEDEESVEEQKMEHFLRSDQFEEDSEDDISPDDTIKVSTVDSATNTDASNNQQREQLKRRSGDRSSTIKRSQTFSPVGRVVDDDYICKLNRSDSDSSVKYRHGRGTFQRHAAERRSLRIKKPSTWLSKSHSISHVDRTKMRTSLDLELDLQASLARLQHMHDEVERLRALTRLFEEAKQRGEHEPTWYTQNEHLQQFLAEADKVLAKQDNKNMSRLDEKAGKLLKKVTKDVQRKRNQAEPSDARSFREKMTFFTSFSLSVPVVPGEDREESCGIPTTTTPIQVKSELPSAVQMNSLRGARTVQPATPRAAKTVPVVGVNISIPRLPTVSAEPVQTGAVHARNVAATKKK